MWFSNVDWQNFYIQVPSWDPISICVPVSSHGLGFEYHMSWHVFMFIKLSGYVTVHLVDIGEIVAHDCLNFLVIILTFIYSVLQYISIHIDNKVQKKKVKRWQGMNQNKHKFTFRKQLSDRIISHGGEVWPQKNQLNPVTIYWCACTKPGKWTIMYVLGI